MSRRFSIGCCAFLGAAAFGAMPLFAANDGPANSGPGGDLAAGLTLQPQYLGVTTEEAPIERTPLMGALDKVGVAKYLDEAGINVDGYAEAGYTYNFEGPNLNDNEGRVFNLDNDRVQINQLALNFERTVDPQVKQFDAGFHIMMLYGTDARFTHANGFLNHFGNEEYQFDIPDLYADFALPVGNGVRLRVGKFEFFKPIDPNLSAFYSHTFAYNNAFPFTNTGITAQYQFTRDLTAEAGISRGYDQASDDNNGAIDGIAKINYSINSKMALTVIGDLGPQLSNTSFQRTPGGPVFHSRGNSDYTAAVDAALTYSMTPQLTLLFDGNFSHIFGSGKGLDILPNGQAPETDLPNSYYGLSGTAIYRINKYVSLAGRFEYYEDDGGLTLGVSTALYSETIGVTITPFPDSDLGSNLKIRPEIRNDYSRARFFGDVSPTTPPTLHDQTTFGIDAIFNF